MSYLIIFNYLIYIEILRKKKILIKQLKEDYYWKYSHAMFAAYLSSI